MPSRVGKLGWFVYPLAMTLDATDQQVKEDTVQIYQNSDFELHNLVYFDDAVLPFNEGLFSIKLGTTNVFFMPDFVFIINLFGSGDLPHKLKQPITFPAGSFIQVVIRNEIAATHTIYLAFEGINKPYGQ